MFSCSLLLLSGRAGFPHAEQEKISRLPCRGKVSYSGEHGTGKRKRKDFLGCYGAAAVEEVKWCKAGLDPEFLLNRGNVFEA